MKKIYKRGRFLIVLSTFIFTASGCASKPRLSGKGELCGVVIDENNDPVADYVVSCKKEPGNWHQTVSNEEGMFFFGEMPYGYYSFKGKKECFVDFEDCNYLFNDCGKVFYFQVKSIDVALDNIERKIMFEDYKGALLDLKKIDYKRKTAAYKVVEVYRDYLEKKIKQIKAESKIKSKEETKNEV